MSPSVVDPVIARWRDERTCRGERNERWMSWLAEIKKNKELQINFTKAEEKQHVYQIQKNVKVKRRGSAVRKDEAVLTILRLGH